MTRPLPANGQNEMKTSLKSLQINHHSGVRTKLLHNAARISIANPTAETRGGKAVQKLCSDPATTKILPIASTCLRSSATPMKLMPLETTWPA
jgi:hypothetical protein